ncbi:MAG: Omp28-related outer membrane protein [Weeksellaceae bacterium]|jgi:hypothetical protein|nr:Omp28-related outer membrane protein [Weeksellaceae bacterium]MDX9704224.1 Omp28-related outer membrane protein [Weeksellaceae bacterium]
MKNLKLTHIFILIFTFSGLLISCGTEEDSADEVLELSLSANSVSVGSSVQFKVTSSISGDVSSQSEFFVNGETITGSSFVPVEPHDVNEVYATYNGKTTSTKTFASTAVIPSEYTQKLLVEDYTGTWCGYCPRMITIIKYLTDYSPNVIPVAIHTPGNPIDPWLYEHAAQMMSSSYYNTGGAPAGQFNRINKIDQDQNANPCPNNREFFHNQVDLLLNQSAPLGLSINSSLNGNNLTMDVKVGFASANITNPKLVVYLIEDGLAHNQANYFSGSTIVNCDPAYDYAGMPNPVQNFPQEHVLLKAYTDIYGDTIPQEAVSEGSVWSWERTYSLPSNVTNTQNLHIVAFVLGNGNSIPTRGALNVQSAPINSFQNFD